MLNPPIPLIPLVKAIELEHFKEELEDLPEEGEFRKANQLKQLTPFINVNGILRVSGTLHASNLPYERKHPIILLYKTNGLKAVKANIYKYVKCHRQKAEPANQLNLTSFSHSGANYAGLFELLFVRGCRPEKVTFRYLFA